MTVTLLTVESITNERGVNRRRRHETKSGTHISVSLLSRHSVALFEVQCDPTLKRSIFSCQSRNCDFSTTARRLKMFGRYQRKYYSGDARTVTNS